MKKELSKIIIFTLLSFCYAQSKNSYKDFFNKNPFLEGIEVYLDDSDALRGKIFKTISEEYDLTANGQKFYGDSDSTHKKINYYFFDIDNKLIKKYFFVIQNERVFLHNEYTYVYGNEECSVLEKDYEQNTQEVIKFKKINNDNNQLYKQIYPESGITKDVQLSQNIKKEILTIFSSDPYILEYELDKENCKLSMVYGEELQRTVFYQKGKEIRNIQESYMDTGKLVEVIEFDENYINGIKKTQVFRNGKLTEEKNTGRVTRKYNAEGFVEYEQIVPFEGKIGTYIIYTAEILNNEDQFLTENMNK